MKAISTALLATTLLLGTVAAHAEGEGNNLALVEQPAGDGVYASYATNARGDLIAVTPVPAAPVGMGNPSTAQVVVSR